MKLSLPKVKTFRFNSDIESKVVKVVGDAGIANATIAQGAMVPLLILDTTERPDLVEVIEACRHFPSGDVHVQWGRLQNKAGSVILVLTFIRPIERTAVIEFEIGKQGLLVEQMLKIHAVYLQAGKPGDRYSTTMDATRMTVEIPDTGFEPAWRKLYKDGIRRRFSQPGQSRKVTDRLVESYLETLKTMTDFRMP